MACSEVSSVFPSCCSGVMTRQTVSDSGSPVVSAERLTWTGFILVRRCMVPEDLFSIIVAVIVLSSGTISLEKGMDIIFSTGSPTRVAKRRLAYRMSPFSSSIAIPSVILSRQCRNVSSIFSSRLIGMVHPLWLSVSVLLKWYPLINFSEEIDKVLGRFANSEIEVSSFHNVCLRMRWFIQDLWSLWHFFVNIKHLAVFLPHASKSKSEQFITCFCNI